MYSAMLLSSESNLFVKLNSMWDLSSLTKVMVTTTSIMLLYDKQLIDLDAAACNYIPEFGSNGKHTVTIRQLLTHTAGLRAYYPFFEMGFTSRDQVLEYICNDKLWYRPGEMTQYSDLSMILLGIVVERISGRSLNVFISEEIFLPLGLQHTCFRPIGMLDFNLDVVPTEVDYLYRKRLLWGEVHDPTAFLLGGVAGHAGLFSSIVDVSRFTQMILAGGMDLASNRRFINERTVRTFIKPVRKTPSNPRPYTLGWDLAVRGTLDGYTPAGTLLGPQTFGHTGFTGTSIWIDPDHNFFVALLTNSIHPSAVGSLGWKIKEIRSNIADAALLAVCQQAIPREFLLWHIDDAKHSKVGLQNSKVECDFLPTHGKTQSLASEYAQNFPENVNHASNLSTTAFSNYPKAPSNFNSRKHSAWRSFLLIIVVAVASR
eukprot:c13825_g1_i1 orf=358-1647(+)